MTDTLHFDVDEALDSMLNVFWEKGFKQSTTKELARRAGLSEGSFFHTFRSKNEAYMRALKRYRDYIHYFIEILEQSESPINGIKQYMEVIAGYASDKTKVNGCMITNATVEHSKDPEIIDFLKSVHQENEDALKITLDRSVDLGELNKSIDTRAVAQLIQHTCQGIRVMSKLNPDKATMENIVNVTMSIFEQYRMNRRFSEN